MAANYTPVSLMGPVAGQPIDYAAQQAQLQNAMQIAMSLIGKSQATPEPTINPSPGNPYARVVPNIGGMISQIASGVAGQRQLGEVNAKQQDLANTILANRMQGIKDVFAPVAMPPRTADVPSPLLTPEMQDQITGAGGSLSDAHTVNLPTSRSPTMQESMQRAYQNSDPQVQAIGSSILQRLGAISEKGTATPGDIFGAGRYFTAPSVAASLGLDAFGNRTVANPAALEHVVEPVVKSAEQTAIGMNKDYPEKSVVLGTGGGTGAPVGAPHPEQNNPAALQKEQLSDKGSLQAGREMVLKANATLPLLGNMIDIVGSGVNSGNLAKVRQEVSQIAQALGAKVDVNKIVDTQTLAAYGMPVVSALVHAITSRATGQEMQMIGQSVGSDMTMTAPAMAKALNQQVATLLNSMTEHRAAVETARKINPNLFTPEMADAFLQNSDPEKALGSVGGGKGVLALKKMPNGMFVADNDALNNAITQDPASVGAAGKKPPTYVGITADNRRITSIDGKNWRTDDGEPYPSTQ